jgi:hypothetical protein
VKMTKSDGQDESTEYMLTLSWDEFNDFIDFMWEVDKANMCARCSDVRNGINDEIKKFF